MEPPVGPAKLGTLYRALQLTSIHREKVLPNSAGYTWYGHATKGFAHVVVMVSPPHQVIISHVNAHQQKKLEFFLVCRCKSLLCRDELQLLTGISCLQMLPECATDLDCHHRISCFMKITGDTQITIESAFRGVPKRRHQPRGTQHSDRI